ncbi:MAG: SdrD B-like domain-containing protein, partial [Chloroflexota bacterium]
DGYYLFDNLDAGRYVVQLLPVNWTSGLLDEYISSTPTTATENTDNNDNGINQVDGDANGTLNEYQTNGVFSNTIQLVPEGEPINETDRNTDNPQGAAEDDNSDLTVDFGVFRPMSLGNIVWLDNGSTAGGFVRSQYNDGIRNGNEPGIQGVTVRLFAADGTTPIEDPFNLGNDYVVTTDAQGYYLFDGLTPGNYVVSIG